MKKQTRRPNFANNFASKIKAASLTDAEAWYATNEKTMFAVDFLGARSVEQIADFWQEELEDRFEELLEAATGPSDAERAGGNGEFE